MTKDQVPPLPTRAKRLLQAVLICHRCHLTVIISFRRSFHPSTEPYSTRSKNQLWCSSRNTIQFLTHVECESSSSGVVEHDLWHDAKRAISRALCQGPRQLLSKLAADQISQPCTLFAELV